ncbi:CorA family divalent cation transporter [Enterococcus italicus]|uniref:CorA family divalent cation transporter n=1 Tax=Enterococcus italicus TaxID=246144 RepID=UPI0028AE211B|nr:CorA family divalent cation transporter [Enterococcus italicus]
MFFDELPDVYLQQNDMSVEMNLVLQILWKLVLSFNRYLKKIKLQLSELEGQIKVSTENKQLYQMLDIQKSLVLIESATKKQLSNSI